MNLRQFIEGQGENGWYVARLKITAAMSQAKPLRIKRELLDALRLILDYDVKD